MQTFLIRVLMTYRAIHLQNRPLLLFGTFSILISGVNSIVSPAPITILTPALCSLNCRGVDELEKRRQRLTSGTFYLVRKSF